MLINVFFDSHFSYCPVRWLFHSRGRNIRINNLQYRALRLIYQDNTSSFEKLLLKDGPVTIHHKYLQNLAIEMFKVKTGEAPSFMNEISSINDNLNSENLNSILPTSRYMAPKIWDMVPNEMKNVASLSIFKNKIRNCTFLKCTCRLCSEYIPSLGFV